VANGGAMTTRDEIVRRAVKLIGTGACRGDIEYTLSVLDITQTNIEFRSKSSKRAAEQFYVALRMVRSAAKKLPANLRFAMFADWLDEGDQFYNGDLNFVRAITRLMEASDRYAREPSSKSARSAYKKRRGSALAVAQIRRRCRDKQGRRLLHTRRSALWQAAGRSSAPLPRSAPKPWNRDQKG
jgi:hypothetical protein